jgi:hypothetical protein
MVWTQEREEKGVMIERRHEALRSAEKALGDRRVDAAVRLR